MLDFVWNQTRFSVAEVGGGSLLYNIGRHAHSKNSYELHFILGGRGTLETDTGTYALKAGDFFITGPHVHHAQTTDPKDPVQDIFIYLQKNDAPAKNAFASLFLNTGFWFSENFDATLAKEILQEYREKQPDYKSAVAGGLMQLLTKITRCFLPEDFTERAEPATINDKRFLLIENAFLYEKDLTLKALSEKIGLCTRQTERLLLKYYGKTFREKKREQTER